jgi:hypothetical protein
MFFQYFVRALIRNKAPLDTVFAYEIWDEYYYFANAAPLNATSGMITAANGQIYDLSSASSKQQMMDDGLVYFTDQVRAAILALDPTALVTISFFQPEGRIRRALVTRVLLRFIQQSQTPLRTMWIFTFIR